MKKSIVLLLIAALLCPLPGCNAAETNTLWVVTEETTLPQIPPMLPLIRCLRM